MKESMSFPEPAPVMATPEQPKDVMEKASAERFDIVRNYLLRLKDQVIDAIPEQIKKPAISAFKSTAYGHYRMATQAIKGVGEGGKQLSGTERLAKGLTSFTWSINTAITIYCSSQKDWESATIVQAVNTMIMPINAYLNNEKEVAAVLEKLKEKFPTFEKIRELVEMPEVELSQLSY